ncbi:MAG TPA: glycosyltransferase family 4 protein [bacterium]|jgi:glycosyltransferase involved in cell wall biosynthesis
MEQDKLTYQNRPLRLTYVADVLNVHTKKWVQYFLDRGCEIKIVSYRHGDIPGTETYVHSVQPIGIFTVPVIKQVYTASDYAKVKSIMKWADIVHAHFIYRYRFNYLYNGLDRLVVSTWGKDVIRDTEEAEPQREKFWKKYVLKRANVITATTEFLKEATKSYAPKGREIHVVPFGVDLDAFNPAKIPPHERSEDEPYRIGFLKHLRTKYGPDVLIDATLILRDRGYNIRVLMAGEGEDEEELRSHAKKIGVGRIVDFVGRVPHEEVPAFLGNLDLFCMPSRWHSESFGVAAIESQAMQVPVVATNVGGVPEAVEDGVGGILVEPENPEAVADAIGELLDNPEKRREMGRQGREYVSRLYDWKNNAMEMEKLYLQLLAGK